MGCRFYYLKVPEPDFYADGPHGAPSSLSQATFMKRTKSKRDYSGRLVDTIFEINSQYLHFVRTPWFKRWEV
jgi:hypothetical protein